MRKVISCMLTVGAILVFIIWHEHMFSAAYVENCVDGVVYLKFARGGISPKFTPDGKVAICTSQGQTEKPVP